MEQFKISGELLPKIDCNYFSYDEWDWIRINNNFGKTQDRFEIDEDGRMYLLNKSELTGVISVKPHEYFEAYTAMKNEEGQEYARSL